MTAHDDQQVAGLIMALEQSIVMGIALAWLFARMLSESEEEERAPSAMRPTRTQSSRAVLDLRGPSTVTSPRTATSRPNVTSPSTASRSAARQRRRAGREAGVEVARAA